MVVAGLELLACSYIWGLRPAIVTACRIVARGVRVGLLNYRLARLVCTGGFLVCGCGLRGGRIRGKSREILRSEGVPTSGWPPNKHGMRGRRLSCASRAACVCSTAPHGTPIVPLAGDSRCCCCSGNSPAVARHLTGQPRSSTHRPHEPRKGHVLLNWIKFNPLPSARFHDHHASWNQPLGLSCHPCDDARADTQAPR